MLQTGAVAADAVHIQTKRYQKSFPGAELAIAHTLALEQKFEETHHHISTSPLMPRELSFDLTPDEQELYQKQGRTNLRWKSCGAESYKPKFICVKCKRAFKPFYDNDAFEYSMTRSGWRVRPNPARPENQALRTAIEYDKNIRKKDNRQRLSELINRYNIDHEPPICLRWIHDFGEEVAATETQSATDLTPLNQAELDELKLMDPEIWWVDLVGLGNNHEKRCPGCGEAGIRVGAKFETPSRSDEKGWNEVAQKIQAGDDMLASFEVCATQDEYEEMIVEAERLKRLKANQDDWEREKKMRQEQLGLFKTTSSQ